MLEIILAQVFGAVALILVGISYFAKNKKIFCLLQMGGDLFYGLAFFVVNSYVAGAITIVSAIRCIYLYFAEKHDFKYKNHWLIVFIVAYIIMTIIFWNNWIDLIPLFTSIMFTIAYAIKNLQKLRYCSLLPNIILVGFNIYSYTFVSAALDFIETLIIIVAIVKYSRNKETQLKKSR